MFWVMLILGIFLEIAKANQWFIIPDICILICFSAAGLILVIKIILYFITQGTFNKQVKGFDFDRFWRDHR